MCGIVGVISRSESAAPLVLESLKTLEYRGYDSAGIATITPKGAIDRVRAEGKLKYLEAALKKHPLAGAVGIGHTRWATHGAPSIKNAHPHATATIAVVHNGIIENFSVLQAERAAAGDVFESDTDTEIILKLLSAYEKEGLSPLDSMRTLLGRLEGAFALAILFTNPHPTLYVARRGSPLVIGYGAHAAYCASDAYALAHLTSRITYLEEGDWAELTPDHVALYNAENQPITRLIQHTKLTSAAASKGNYRHFMQKEIFEQPMVLGDTLTSYVRSTKLDIEFPDGLLPFASLDRLMITACGTSYYAGMVAKYWFEHIAGLATDVSIASEFRYASPVFSKQGACLCISQSGETADTLAALHYAKAHHQASLAIVNVEASSLSRSAEASLQTFAGPEIGVASTKAFTTQLAVLACLALKAGQLRGTLSQPQMQARLHALLEIPSHVSAALQCDALVRGLAAKIAKARDVLYIGRGLSFPIALEGALKLKEISYIHAEGIAAGELKHGSIALIDKHVPVIVVAPPDALFEKLASNVQEIAARGGKVILISTKEKIAELGALLFAGIPVPEIDDWLAPILYAIPVQLLAYHTAVHKGTDVDQPRNLAKSVTVE